MFDSLDKAIADLKDTKAGWVTRRDAAEALGEFAHRATGALETCREEDDVDVRSAVEKALRQATPAVTPPKRRYKLAELVATCHKPPHREVTGDGEGFKIRLQIDQERWQTVYVEAMARKDGQELVHIYTVCGTPTDEALHWGLKTNAKLVHCALAVQKHDDTKRLILVNNLDRTLATPGEVKSVVKEIARYGDWLEEKLTGRDEL